MRPKFWVVALLFMLILIGAFIYQNAQTVENFATENARRVKLKGGKVFHVGINGTPMILSDAEYQYVSKLELRAGRGCDGFGMLD